MTTAKRKCIMVLGMHRSGTSALTRTLSLMGATLPVNLMPPVPGNNEAGFWEPQAIANLNNAMLKEAGGRWDDWRPFDFGALSEDRQEHYRSEIKNLIGKEFGMSPLFVLKDPRISRLVPLYASALAEMDIESLFVLCNRHPGGVVASLAKRDGMTEDFGNLVWLRHETDAEAATRGLPRASVSYEEILQDWRGAIAKIGKALALDWPRTLAEASAEIDSYLRSDLRHHNPIDLAGAEGSKIKEWVREAYGAMKLLEAAPGDIEACRTLDRVKRELDSAAAIFGAAFFLELRARGLRAEISAQASLDEVLWQKEADRENSAAKLAVAENRAVEQATSIKQLTESVNKLNERAAETDQLRSQSVILKSSVSTLEAQLANTRSSLANAKASLASAREGEKIFKKRQQSAVRHLEALRNSTSWRLTRPLRGVKRALTEEGFARRCFVALARIVYYRLSVHRLLSMPVVGGVLSGIKNRILGSDSSSAPTAHNHTSLAAAPPIAARPKTLRIQELLADGGSRTIVDANAEAVSFARSLIDGRQNSPTISVIMPTWNRSKTVCVALRSGLGQSLPPTEIVVSDDGSTDDTIAVIEANFPAEVANGKIKIVRNEHNGVSAARNAALSVASGEIISYLDSDNVWRENFLLIVVAAFIESDEISAVYAALSQENQETGQKLIRAQSFDRTRLLRDNFIDLNIFAHRRHLFDQFGGFRRDLTRLVDWELIIRYTKNYTPVFLPFIGVDYYLAPSLNNLTNTQPLAPNRSKVDLAHRPERLRLGLEPLRIAYFVYDYPALSQTFVFSEIRELLRRGADVKVYYAAQPERRAEVDFEVESYKVSNAADLADLFVAHGRNICHSHFAYPGVTNFVQPACQATGVRYTFMPHAVDIFHEANRQRSRVGALGADPLCLKVFVYGDFHRKFLEQQGVPRNKIAYAFQAVDLAQFAPRQPRAKNGSHEKLRIVAIGRFIEKKGFEYLIRALALLPTERFQLDLYGYGPLDAHLRGVVAELDLSNVSFRGAVSGADALSEVYAEADLLVAPCIEAKNGDTDGFPTVILEAMAVGVPVLSTTISAIPDYLRNGVEALLVPPNSTAALAASILTYAEMPADRQAAIIRRAGEFVQKHVGADLTVQRLLDVWLGYEVDIVLVTYNSDRYDDRRETLEIISRILNRTTTNFTLTIIDNDSDDQFWTDVTKLVSGWGNVRLIRKQQNIFCGPASNAAISYGTAEFIIYVCSKEGFVKTHGWERGLVETMRKHPTVGIAGHLSYLPKHVLGEEMLNHPAFHLFRAPSFAQANPRRKFSHVQGGAKIMRRAVFEASGGYNPLTPQGNMDVEFSYYVESLGYDLLQLHEVASVTQKTLPGLPALLDERSVIAHPLHLSTVEQRLDTLDNSQLHACNLCGSSFAAFVPGAVSDDVGACPNCGSLSLDRLVYRKLASSPVTYRGGNCAFLGATVALPGKLSDRMFRHVVADNEPSRFQKKLEGAKRFACIVVDPRFVGKQHEYLWNTVAEKIESGGEIFIAEPSVDGTAVIDLVRSLETGLLPRSFSVDMFDVASEHVGYDWRRLICINVVEAAGA